MGSLFNDGAVVAISIGGDDGRVVLTVIILPSGLVVGTSSASMNGSLSSFLTSSSPDKSFSGGNSCKMSSAFLSCMLCTSASSAIVVMICGF